MPKATKKGVASADFMSEKEASLQHYEMLMLLPGSSSEQEVEVTSKEVVEFLESQQCEMTKNENLGRKSLGYTVAGSRNGTYVLYEFNAPTSVIGMLNEKLRIRKDVARFLIVRKLVKTDEQVKEEARVRGIIEGRKAAKKAATPEVVEEAPKKPRRAKKTSAEAPAAAPENIDTQIDKLIEEDVKL